LDDTKYEKCHELTLDIFQSVNETHKGTLRNIGSFVDCGYNYLTAFGDETLINLCKYLNLWLDVQKSIYVNGESNVSEEDWQIVENVWDDLDRHYGSSKCRRQEDRYDISNKKKHMELLKYCIYRDHIKKRCESIIKHNSNIQRYCPALSEYTDKKYEEFKSENTCLDNSDGDNLYKYYVSDECTLYNMSKTFPVFDSGKKAILDDDNDDNIRKAIKECRNAVKVEDRLQEQAEDGTNGPSELPESDNGHAESEDVRTGLENGFSESTDLGFSSATAVTSPNDKHSKPIYYAGLSVSGAFFTSMVLYKV
ncbi:hypothetical protein PVC01_000065600, partial [Plasmodium vivax]